MITLLPCKITYEYRCSLCPVARVVEHRFNAGDTLPSPWTPGDGWAVIRLHDGHTQVICPQHRLEVVDATEVPRI